MIKNKTTIILYTILFITLFSSIFAIGITQFKKSINSSGIIVEPHTIEIFDDPNCKIKTKAIHWGILVNGTTVNKTIYLKNSGSVGVLLNTSIINWNPIEASNFINITCNYDSTIIEPKQIKEINLILSVGKNINYINFFQFIIIITGYSQ